MNATLLTVLIVAVLGGTLAFAYGKFHWKSVTKQLGQQLDAARLPFVTKVFAAGELDGLPAPVQRFLRAALTDGQRIVAGVAIEQTGTFNQSESTAAWKPFTATQRGVTRRPGYFWDANIRMFPGVPVRVRDAYVAGEGILQAAVFGLFPVANLRDPGELAKGELMRFLAEAAWYPTALLRSCWLPGFFIVAWPVGDGSNSATSQPCRASSSSKLTSLPAPPESTTAPGFSSSGQIHQLASPPTNWTPASFRQKRRSNPRRPARRSEVSIEEERDDSTELRPVASP